MGANSSPGGYNRTCWETNLLPFLEQGNLYSLIQANVGSTGSYAILATSLGGPAGISTGVELQIKNLICPSDPNGGKNAYTSHTAPTSGHTVGFQGNYSLCASGGGSGSITNLYSTTNLTGGQILGSNPTQLGQGIGLNGIFFAQSSTRITDITDGTSNTLMGSEILQSPGGPGITDERGAYYDTWDGNTLLTTFYPPNTTQPDVTSLSCQTNYSFAPCTNSSTNRNESARSVHLGGVNALMADGSVKFVSNSVSITTWQAVGTRAGGETPGSDL